MEFRIARTARDYYAIDETLFSIRGEAMVIDTAGARRLAEYLAPDDARAQERVAADVSALGLLHELGHRAAAQERAADGASGRPIALALDHADERLGASMVSDALAAFESAFPTSAVYGAGGPPHDTLAGAGREDALEELLLTWLARANPAAAPYAELIDDPLLASPDLVSLLDGVIVDGAAAPADSAPLSPLQGLAGRLRQPMVAAPTSLATQLRWTRLHWAGWLDTADLLEIDRQLGINGELERETWLRHQGGGRERAAEPASFAGFGNLDAEPEAFSHDLAWMAELVLVAKSTYVWLSQLSRAYERSITRLDQIPDEELDELRDRGITGLWLIGLWQRSGASGRVKRMRGDIEAMASAYSVADYRIADELGGDDAWRDLRDRAEMRGIRLAADMVPNHMGIDADWVIEHPDRFISTPHPPFGSYRFSGDDLSDDERVAIQIEDHYWEATDAAVVFKRTDRASGEERYIYHGNDGTSFPWNDTAQLDYLRADVREAVIDQILDVARRFHVIRFDAAMVLARRHIQRLWYPLPGHEPGVPSRSIASMSAADFARLLPLEFWREVVDRVAAEVPDTLLLAEAFWLMEGYFVRSLGMHRVYNSAFMHMLRDERNKAYQQVIAETVAFDRRILGRYVNFMSNPDERTAIDQFGSHDKYFGVATLLATLPGLPMVGHGQIEGYDERYGMEFRHPRTDETLDVGLVERHRREIFPLFRQRWRFADASGFRQLRALDGMTQVDDVFAYANRAARVPDGAGEARSLVVFLNRYDRARVRVVGVADALGLDRGRGRWLVLRDHRTGLEFLRHAAESAEHGLELELDGYACHVFLAFREVADGDDAAWSTLANRIGLSGVPNVDEAMRRLRQEPVREAAAGVFTTSAVTTALLTPPSTGPLPNVPELAAALGRVYEHSESMLTRRRAELLVERLTAARSILPSTIGRAVAASIVFAAITPEGGDDGVAWNDLDVAQQISQAARRAGNGDEHTWRIVELAAALAVIGPGMLTIAAAAETFPDAWFEDASVRAASGWHRFGDQVWVVAEAWDEFVAAVASRDALLNGAADPAAVLVLRQRAAAAGYRVGPAS